MGSKRDVRPNARRNRKGGDNRNGSSFPIMFRILLLLAFGMGLTMYSYNDLTVSVATPRKKTSRSTHRSRLRAKLLARSSSEDLVDQAISELESVIIATSSDIGPSQDAKISHCIDEETLRRGRARVKYLLGDEDPNESDKMEQSKSLSQQSSDEDDSDDGENEMPNSEEELRSPTSCGDGEVLISGPEYERLTIIQEFDKDMSFHKTFKRLQGIPESFDTLQTALELPPFKYGPNNHLDIESIIGALATTDSGPHKGRKQNVGESSDSNNESDGELDAFREQIRQGRTYAKINKNYLPLERALKSLGYKQSTAKAKRSPFILGYLGEQCPSFSSSSSEPRIYFCAQLVPSLREQDQYALLHAYANENPDISLNVQQLFPMTFRLFKQDDLQLLKGRVMGDKLELEGGPYITKITSAHGAGTTSLTVKISDVLKKSHNSAKLQNQDAKLRKIAQVYINNPYLYEGKKFIIRNWAVVVSVNPLVVLFRDGALNLAVESYVPFVKRDASYKRAMHFTNEKSSHKSGPLRSSSLYASLPQFQKWLTRQGLESPDFVRSVLKPQMRARMIYALEAILKYNDLQDTDVKIPKRPVPPKDVVVLQTISFDFLLDTNKNLWLLGVNTGSNSFFSFGNDNFRPSWKVSLQESFTTNFVQLAEEVLWRKMNNYPITSASLSYDPNFKVLIDETREGWNSKTEISKYLAGYVEEEEEDESDEEEGFEEELGDANVEPSASDEEQFGSDDRR